MKSQHLLPALAALIGFGTAWLVKPAPPAPPAADAAHPDASPASGSRTRPGFDRESSANRRPQEVSAADFPLAEQADQGPKSRTEAKMNRLVEALGLTLEQQAKLIAAVEAARAKAGDDKPVIEDFANRGRELLEALKSILSPEQLAAFEEIRERERDNMIESRAQDRLAKVLKEIDLSPGQREELLARLKQFERTQIQEVPAAATLLLSTSILPTEQTDLTMDGVLALTRMGEAPAHPEDMRAAHLALQNRQQGLLEDELRCFEGILTPGQMSQYHAMLNERKQIMEQVRRNTLDGTRPKDGEDPRKLYGDPAPDPRLDSEDEDLDKEEEYEPEDDLVEDAAGNPIAQ